MSNKADALKILDREGGPRLRTYSRGDLIEYSLFDLQTPTSYLLENISDALTTDQKNFVLSLAEGFIASGASPFPSAGQLSGYVQSAFQSIQNVTTLKFQALPNNTEFLDASEDSPKSATPIRIMTSTYGKSGGLPGDVYGLTFAPQSFDARLAAENTLTADVWLYGGSITSGTPGKITDWTVQHEVLHAIGLYGDFSASDDRFQTGNVRNLTVLAYAREFATPNDFAADLQLYDIWALQNAYGYNASYATGSNTYSVLSSDSRRITNGTWTSGVVTSIWDAGGIDTINFSAAPNDTIIDLRQGEFSSTAAGSGFFGSSSVLDNPGNNISIAWGTVIENATGGNHSDLIIGNLTTNRLYGGNGDDAIFGGSSAFNEFSDRGLTYIGDILQDSAIAAKEYDNEREDWDYAELNGARPEENGDYLYGGDGNDFLGGGDGDDRLFGQKDNDLLEGGNGLDKLDGGDGEDKLRGGAGDDELKGGKGEDELFGGEDDDKLDGGEDDDKLFGEDGKDELRGGAGADELYGGADDDVLFGDADDTLLDGGEGEDTVDYSDAKNAIDWELVSAQIKNIEIVIGSDHDDTLTLPKNLLFPDIEVEVRGGEGDDVLTGNNARNTLLGEDGDDNITGGSDDDRLEGGTGNDTIDGAAGDDRIIGGTGNDELSGGTGVDTISGEDGDDIIRGGYEDWILGEGDVLDGGAGDDFIQGEGGNDIVFGGADDDYIVGGIGRDYLYGGSGSDTVDGASNDFTSIGVTFADHLWGGSGADRFLTNDDDTIYDADATDIAFLAGQLLTGGEETSAGSGTYQDANGTSYTRSGADLIVTTAGIPFIGTSTLTIKNFMNGDAGIWLRDKTNPDDPNDPEQYRSPLVLDLNGDGSVVSAMSDQRAYFDFAGDGMRELTAWFAPDDGLLVLDRDANGTIDNAGELFGHNPVDYEERGSYGGMARLMELDSDRDGYITAADLRFADLRVWQDRNANGLSEEGELASLADLGIVSIELDYFDVEEFVADGIIAERSSFTWADGSEGVLVDAWFRTDPRAALPTNTPEISDAIAALPFIGGSGRVPDLHSAMALDPLLEEMVAQFAALPADQLWRVQEMVEQIVLRWTGGDAATGASRGEYVDGRHLAAVEAWSGDDFVQQLGWTTSRNPYPQAAAALNRQYVDLVTTITARLIAQTDAGDALLPEIGYALDAVLTLEESFTVEGFVAAALATSPSDPWQQWSHWKSVVTLAEALASDTGIDRAQLVAAVDAAATSLSPQMTYNALRRTVIAQGDGDTVVGTSNELDFDADGFDAGYWTLPDTGGIDWMLGSAGNDTFVTGYGRDTILFGIGAGHDRVIDRANYNNAGLEDSEERVQLLGDLQLSELEFSLVEMAGQNIARIAIPATGDTLDFHVNSSSFESVVVVAQDGSSVRFDVQGGLIKDLPQIYSLAELDFILVSTYGTPTMSVRLASDGSELLDLPGFYIDIEDQVAFAFGQTPVLLSEIDAEILSRIQTEGRDTIRAGARGDTITALGGDDRVDGGKGDDAIDGGSGNDLIEGGSGNDIITGGTGADTLRGGRGGDIYHFARGDGVDIVEDPFGLNTLVLGAGIALTDLVLSRGSDVGDLVIRLEGTTDQIVVENQFGAGSAGFETIRFADGSELTREEIEGLVPGDPGIAMGSVLQLGTEGEDVMTAVGDVTIATGLGGRDTYVFNAGDGTMFIGDTDTYDWDDTKPDILQFGEGIAPGDLSFKILGELGGPYFGAVETPLEISIAGTDDRIIIYNYVAYATHHEYRDEIYLGAVIDTVRFADGQEWDLTTFLSATEKGTPGNDILWAWGEGTVLNGGAGDDFFYVSTGSRIVEDMAVYFGPESGHDQVSGMGVTQQETHRVLLAPSLTLGDLNISPRFDSSYYDGLTISLADGSASLDILDAGVGLSLVFGDGTVMNATALRAYIHQNAWTSNGDAEFDVNYSMAAPASGTPLLLSIAEMGSGRKTVATSRFGEHVVFQLPDGVSLHDVSFRPEGGQIVMKVPGVEGEVWIMPALEDLNFTIVDAAGNTMPHAQVNALLTNNGANSAVDTAGIFENSHASETFWVDEDDTFYFGYGDGQDEMYAAWSGGGTVTFKAGITSGDVTITPLFQDTEWGAQYTDRLSVALSGSDDRLIASHGPGGMNFLFEDGTEIKAIDLARDIITKSVTEGDDTLSIPYSLGADFVVTPGKGDDKVIGDSMVAFGRGDGHDEVYAAGLVLTDAYSLSEFSVEVSYRPEWEGTASKVDEYKDWIAVYTLTYWDSGDSITFEDRYDFMLTFADGNSVGIEAVVAKYYADAFTNRDDKFTVLAFNDSSWQNGDLIDARGGDDWIDGRLTNTVYLFGYGDGTDTIIENDLWDDYFFDAIRFKEGVTPNDVTITVRANGDVVFALAGSDDKIIMPGLSNRLFRPGIEQIEFSDGTKWSMLDVLRDLAVATDGDDVIYEVTTFEYQEGEWAWASTYWPSRYEINESGVFDGGAGNDVLAGGAGSDFYVFDVGYGHDTIIEKSPMPLIFEVWSIDEFSDSYPEPEIDVLTLGPGIFLDDLEFLRGGKTGDDLVIRIIGTEDQITIVDQFNPLGIEDATPWYFWEDAWETEDPNGNGIADPHELYYPLARWLSSSPNGIEVIRLSSQQIDLNLAHIVARIAGTDNSGDNIYHADPIGGTLDGGVGNDKLFGSEREDDYVFAAGYGEDTICDPGGYDIVNFGEGIRQEWLLFTRFGESGDDLLIEVDGPERLALTVKGQFATAPGAVEEFTFLTGNVLTWLDVQEIILASARTGGDDAIAGFLTSDTIRGGDGNDRLEGREGDDLLMGEAGRDTAVLQGARADYTIDASASGFIVTDGVSGRDGQDTLVGIEELYFAATGETLVLIADPGAPDPANLTFGMAEDTRLEIGLDSIMASLAGAAGGPFELVEVTGASTGQVWRDLLGNVVFEPDGDFFGDATFSTVFVNAEGTRGMGLVTVSVVNTPDAPYLANPLADAVFHEDEAIAWTLPADAFADPDGEALSITVTLADGSALPEWLHFDGATLKGQPHANFNGALSLLVAATDGSSTATDMFELDIVPVNDAPVANGPIAPIAAVEGEFFAVDLPPDIFTDVDGDALVLSLLSADGSAAPAWLDIAGGMLSGTGPDGLTGIFSLLLIASDGLESAELAIAIDLAPANAPPVVGTPVGDRTFAEDEAVLVTLPADAFADPDGDALTLRIRLANGDPIPQWLAFDGERLTGQPPQDVNGSWDFVITASDGQFAVKQAFTLSLTPVNDAPVAQNDGVFLTRGSGALVIAAADLLGNDTDVEGAVLTIVSVTGAADGAVSLNSDSSVAYTPHVGYRGADSFTYTVSDGELTAQATVTVEVLSPYDNWYQGTDLDDVIFGDKGSVNRIFGRAGRDHIKGGELGDYLAGGDGDDQIQGLQGDDHLWGNAGDDHLVGGPGTDTAYYRGYLSEYMFETSGGELFVRANHDSSTAALDDGSDRLSSIERLTFRGNQTIMASSPIVLDLDGNGIETLTSVESGVRVDMNQDGAPDRTSWIGAGDAFLFFDRDSDGTLTSVAEMSFIDDAPAASSDLDGLRRFDTNDDGIFSAADADFDRFGVWQDKDTDGRVDKGEIMSLSDIGLEAIDLTGSPVDASYAPGEVAVINTGSFTYSDGSMGEFADVALTYYSGRGAPPWIDLDALMGRPNLTHPFADAPAVRPERGVFNFGIIGISDGLMIIDQMSPRSLFEGPWLMEQHVL